MDISGKTMWQQAAGDTDRNYSDLCLDWDVILNGPGLKGEWPAVDPKCTPRKVTDLRRFAKGMQDGDLVVLRMGTSRVLGVGQIVGPYEWCDEFGDVDGWDLQHVRRVRWLWDYRRSESQFAKSAYSLKLGDTTQRLKSGPVTEWLATLPVSEQALCRPLRELPSLSDDNKIDVNEISEFLFDNGVASTSITTLLNEIGELTRIAKWYQRSSMPSEHETVAYLIVPLLRALGWTPQRMAVEWNHVDLALFEKLPREDGSLQVVVEAKKMDNSCLTAESQATRYTATRPGCGRLIVTDGLRYGVFIRSEGKFKLYAYLNLTRLRRDYPIYDCKGAEEALLAMAPEWTPNVEV